MVLAEEVPLPGYSADDQPWLRFCERLLDDFRAALDWLTRQGATEWGMRLALRLFTFWERGEPAEGRRRLEALAALESSRDHPALRARTLFAAGVLASVRGDATFGSQLHEECLQIYETLGDQRGIVVSLIALGNHYMELGEYARARSALERSLQVWAELGDEAGFARSLSNLAFVARTQGRFDEARQTYQQAASTFDRLGDSLSRAWSANHEGDIAREQGELAAAEALYEQALATFRERGNGWGVASSLGDLAMVARQRGDAATAGRLYREALTSFVALDHKRGIARTLESLACLAERRAGGARCAGRRGRGAARAHRRTAVAGGAGGRRAEPGGGPAGAGNPRVARPVARMAPPCRWTRRCVSRWPKVPRRPSVVDGIEESPHRRDAVRGQAGPPRVLGDRLLVGGQVDAVHLVVGDVAVDPLDPGPSSPRARSEASEISRIWSSERVPMFWTSRSITYRGMAAPTLRS